MAKARAPKTPSGSEPKGKGVKRSASSPASASTGASAGEPGTGKAVTAAGRPSTLLDTRVIYCGDNLEQLAKLPGACIDLIYIDPPFNSNRN